MKHDETSSFSTVSFLQPLTASQRQPAKRRLFCDLRRKDKDKDAAAIVALLASEG
jgi:hypothetical protein